MWLAEHGGQSTAHGNEKCQVQGFHHDLAHARPGSYLRLYVAGGRGARALFGHGQRAGHADAPPLLPVLPAAPCARGPACGAARGGVEWAGGAAARVTLWHDGPTRAVKQLKKGGAQLPLAAG